MACPQRARAPPSEHRGLSLSRAPNGVGWNARAYRLGRRTNHRARARARAAERGTRRPGGRPGRVRHGGGRARHRQDAPARRASSPCRGGRVPGARRLGDGVRARPAVQRLGGRARRLRRLAGARPRRSLERGARGGALPSDPIRPAAQRRRPGNGCRRALPNTPRGAQAARAPRRRAGRSWSCWTISTGATRRPSSCSPGCCSAHPRLRCCSRSRSAPAGHRHASRPRSRFRPSAGSGSCSSTTHRRPSCSARWIPVRQRSWCGRPAEIPSIWSSSSAPARTAPSKETDAGVDVAGVSVPAAVAASLADELASLPADERTLLRAAAVAGEPFEPDLAGAIAELPPLGCARPARRAAGARPRPPHDGAPPVRLPAPPRPAGGLRVGPAGLAARGPRAGRGSACRPRGGRRGPCTSRRAVRGPGRRTGHRAPPRSRRLGGVARPGGGRPLVRGRPGPAPGIGRRPVGRGAHRPRLGAPLARRARTVPRHAARGDRAAFHRTPPPAGSS